jgi:DNA-binding transcriptional regulator LsrR (DeoR family)
VKSVPAKGGGASRRSYSYAHNHTANDIAHDTGAKLKTPKVPETKSSGAVKPAYEGTALKNAPTSQGINMDALRPYFPIRPR